MDYKVVSISATEHVAVIIENDKEKTVGTYSTWGEANEMCKNIILSCIS